MAQAAEEYGSHDKTFEIYAAGTVRVSTARATLIEHDVERRRHLAACRTKDAPSATGCARVGASARQRDAGVFWLDESRAHDAQLLREGPRRAGGARDRRAGDRGDGRRGGDSLHARPGPAGEDTISVTGNVLRDYLTDLFPILELGTSAKMQSIVPLMNGGGLFETGAGGSAPKHVSQFLARTICAGTRSASSSRWCRRSS